MDGESFFSFRGLFPPQPSAWEKIKLGDDVSIVVKFVDIERKNIDLTLIRL
jgi:ribosomal protein S1